MTSSPPRLCLILSEVLLLIALFAAMAAGLVRIREESHSTLPPPYTWIGEFPEMLGWRWEAGVTTGVTLLVGISLHWIRTFIPEGLRSRVYWFRSVGDLFRPESLDANSPPLYSWSALRTVCLLMASNGILLTVAAHATIDRSSRQPVVTWNGPLVNFLIPLTLFSECLAIAGAVNAWRAIDRSPYFFDFWEWVGVALVIANFIGTLGFFGEAYND